MTAVPDDLAAAVHRAARATPPHAADLANVHRRYRARRRRRAVAAAGGLVVLVALSGGAVPLLTGPRDPSSPATAPTTTAAVPATSPPTTTALVPTPAPAQRLLIDGGGGTWQPDNGGPEVGLVGGVADEVLPDGTVRRHRVPKGWEQTVALPDGRLVGLQLTDLMPGVRRRDGPDVEGLSIKLVVLGPDDAVEQAREVRVKGEGVELLGADGRAAYLARDGGIVAHDLATGQEKFLLRSSTAGVDLLAASQTELGPDRLVEQRSDDGCRTDVRRLSDGKRILRLTVEGLCENGLRLSPNGRLVAVPYHRLLNRTGSGREQRLAVFDIATGALRADQLVGTPRRAPVPGGIQGVAWADNTTVRVAWGAVPEGADRVYSVAEVMKVVTVSVQ